MGRYMLCGEITMYIMVKKKHIGIQQENIQNQNGNLIIIIK